MFSEPTHEYIIFYSCKEATKPWQACVKQYGEIKAQQIRCKLLQKRSLTKAALKKISANETKKRQAIARQLWFLDGILATDASWAALNRVRRQYEKLNLVPQGYNMADLWLA